MIFNSCSILLLLSFSLLSYPPEKELPTDLSTGNYQQLVTLFKEWRTFETPPLRDGAPDYTAETFEKRRPLFKKLQERLLGIDTAGWPVEQQVDWYIVRAEMNGYDFNQRVLKPWVRDPAFYKSLWTYRSDVPAHEGPTHHMTTEIWTYTFPLKPAERKRLLGDLRVIPPLNAQAKINLTGNAKDLWIAGIRDIRSQSVNLKKILQRPGVGEDQELVTTIQAAITATDDLTRWLEAEAKTKTGPSGIGRENYTWYLQHVHLVPMTWEDEVRLLKRELARAWSSLKMEEHRNRHLPPLVDADSPEAYNKLAEKSAQSLMRFLEQEEIVTVKDYFEPALRQHLGEFVPKDRRNFFWIGAHYDPRPLYSHFYHWFELARMDNEPHRSEIRKGPLLYNIFDSRNEGMATAVEEMFMQAGLYDDNPRVREIVYIMIAQRAARGLGSLYAHANDMTMEEAGGIHSEYTPRGWMKTEKELLIFEQHLYLRQPGYGTSYITGKYLLEEAMAEFARIQELKKKPFRIKDFFDRLNTIGNIPVALGHWELTGRKAHLQAIVKNEEMKTKNGKFSTEKELLLNMLEQNRYTCSFTFEELSADNVDFRLNQEASSAGFMYRHIGEIMHMYSPFFGEPNEVPNTTMGFTDTGQGKDLEQSKLLVEKGYEMLENLIEKHDDAGWWLEKVDTPFFGEVPRMRIFSHVLFHNSHHAGQISLTLSKGQKY